MSSVFCDFCNKEFKRNSDLVKHKNRKTPCKVDNTIEIATMSSKNTELINLFKGCFDILRDNEHLVADKALKNLSYFLALKLIEPQIESKNIDIEGYNGYSTEHLEEFIIKNHYDSLFKISRFSFLSSLDPINLFTNLKYLWSDILAVHPKTKNIYPKDKFFDIKNQSTFEKIINKLNSFDFTKVEEDILGSAYEDVVKNVMVGKALGQFFTPPKVKNMMVELIQPQVKEDGTIETIFDPAMGTGGFLITSSRYLIQQAKDKNISLDWDFIAKRGLGGREAETDTFQLANLNMLISTGHMFESIDCGDSIRSPIEHKYDIILANPPFGISGMNYNEIVSKNSISRDEYLPIKSSSAVPLFLQAMIYMLNINGRCAVVVPDGKDLFAKTPELVNTRKFLMKCCDLQEVIYLPSNIFTNTSIKTCVFYFTKRYEGNRVLAVQNKSKTRVYNFAEGHSTPGVKFYNFNPETDVKEFICEVPIDELAKNNYSLNYNEYIKVETKKEIYNEEIEIKTLGEVCEFLSKSKRPASYGEKNGIYPFFKSSMKVNTFVNIPDYEIESIIIGDGGEPNVNYGQKFSASDHCYILQNKTNNSLKYIYYYLYLNISSLEKYYTGVAIKNISKTSIQNIPIPIPSLEKQNKIVEYLDFLFEKCIKNSNNKIEEINQCNKYYLENQINFNNFEVKTLGDVCKVKQGTYITPEMKIEGIYPVYGGGNPSFYINQNNREDEIIIAKDGVSIDCVRYEKNKFFLNHHGWTLNCNDSIIKKYFYYYLLFNQQKLYDIAKGTAQKGINQENFYKLTIPIPPLEKQEEIVKYIEFNEGIINCLNYDIEQNKKLAQEFLNNSVKLTE